MANPQKEQKKIKERMFLRWMFPKWIKEMADQIQMMGIQP
jgi:hypothetical protein